MKNLQNPTRSQLCLKATKIMDLCNFESCKKRVEAKLTAAVRNCFTGFERMFVEFLGLTFGSLVDTNRFGDKTKKFGSIKGSKALILGYCIQKSILQRFKVFDLLIYSS